MDLLYNIYNCDLKCLSKIWETSADVQVAALQAEVLCSSGDLQFYDYYHDRMMLHLTLTLRLQA